MLIKKRCLRTQLCKNWHPARVVNTVSNSACTSTKEHCLRTTVSQKWKNPQTYCIKKRTPKEAATKQQRVREILPLIFFIPMHVRGSKIYNKLAFESGLPSLGLCYAFKRGHSKIRSYIINMKLLRLREGIRRCMEVSVCWISSIWLSLSITAASNASILKENRTMKNIFDNPLWIMKRGIQ